MNRGSETVEITGVYKSDSVHPLHKKGSGNIFRGPLFYSDSLKSLHFGFWRKSCYWKEKFEKNVERDRKQIRELEDLGWNVVIIWECEIKSKKKREERLNRLINELTIAGNK